MLFEHNRTILVHSSHGPKLSPWLKVFFAKTHLFIFRFYIKFCHYIFITILNN